MEYRMYCLAERHLSSIQKAIQSAHAIVEYSSQYGNDEEYKQWARNDKTIIILDGGTLPEMQLTDDLLNLSGIRYATFAEPDMGNMLTAICFLADERVWDYGRFGRSYKDFECISFAQDDVCVTEEDWVKSIGGEGNRIKKDIVSSLKIAL